MMQHSNISTPRDEHARKVLRGDRDFRYTVATDPDLLLERNVIVRAGAGSGKTSILIDRMIVLVRKGVAPSAIVAITFTNRAAAELKERFFKRLLAIRSDLAEKDGAEWEEERERVEQALRHSDEAFIGTIHSFCLRLLRQRSLEVGLPPDFRQIEESDELTLRQSFWQARVEEAHASDDPDWAILVQGDVSWSGLFNFFGMLSSNQSVDFPQSNTERPELFESYSLTLRVLDVLSAIIPPSDNPDAFMTAVERACLRVQADEEDDFKRVRVMKALMEGVRGSEESELDITASRWDADRKSELNKLASSLKKGEDDLLDGGPVREPILGVIRQTVEIWDAWLHDAALRFAGQAVEAYRTYRVREGLLTYDDLLHEARRLVFSSASSRVVFQDQYGFFLVDEFQDTDPAQAALLFGLCSRAPDTDDWTASRLESGRLFVVGDDKQSIYRFRKADFQVFGAVARAVIRDGGEEIRLTANFRTDEALCDWINGSVGEVFASRQAPYQAAWEQLEPAKGRIGPAQPVVHLAIGKSGQRAQKPRVVAEAATIARLIHDSVKRGDSRPGDHMVLVRRHSNVPVFLNMFSRLSIPVSLPGGKQRGAESVIRLVHDLFRVLLDPNDGIALVAILRGILFGIPDTDLQEYHSSGGRWRGRMADAAHLDGAPQPIKEAGRTLADWAKLVRQERPATAFETLLAGTGLYGGLLREPNGELLAGTLRRIGSLLTSWDEKGLSFASCVHELGRFRSGELNLEPFSVAEPFGACVRILTVHSSKGLQAPYVYLADCLPDSSHLTKLHVRREGGKLVGSGLVVRGSAPFESAELRPARWLEDAEEESNFEQAEAHRLLYVAATRAKKQLIVSSHAEAGKGSGSWDMLGAYFDHAMVRRIEVDPPNTELPSETATNAGLTEDSGQSAASPSTRPVVGPPRWTLRRPSESGEDDHRKGPGAGLGRTMGMQYGSAMHSLFEAVVARRKMGVDEAIALQLAGQVMERELGDRIVDEGTGSSVTSRIKNATASMMAFVESDIWKQLESADRVLTEVPFTTQSMDGDLAVVTSGVVDLAFRTANQWTIVDYKTDRAEESVLIERHALQIEAYVRAWSSLFPDEPCRGLIWSTALDRFIPIKSHQH